jgi:hypothetical protein
MARDLLIGKTKRQWSRGGTNCGSMLPKSLLPEGATGYAPTKWWTPSQAEEKVQELMKSGGIFGTPLPRDTAEKKTMAYLRKNLIGITSREKA